MKVNVKMYDDGSFDIAAGQIRLIDCFPGMDGRPLRPVHVEVTRGSEYCQASYTLDSEEGRPSAEGRRIVIRIADATDGGGIAISSELHGFSSAPHWFYPSFQARAESFRSVYRQGFGMGAATGLLAEDHLAEQPAGRTESYGLAVLGGEDYYLSCHADKHDTFVHRYELQTFGSEEGETVLSAGFRMERVPLEEEAGVRLPDTFF